MILNTILLFLSEAISDVVSGVLANHIGRVQVLKYFSIICGLSYFALHFFLDNIIIRTIAIFTCGLGVSGNFNVSYIYTPEILPTIIRSTATSNLILFSRFGGFIIPTLVYFIKYDLLFFGILALINSVLVSNLSETLGKKLEDSIPEMIEVKK